MGTTDFFFNHVLPPIRPEFNVDRIYNFCIKNKTLIKREKSRRYMWKELQSGSKDVDNGAYRSPFINIFRAIVDAAQKTSLNSSDVIPAYFMPTDRHSEKDKAIKKDENVYLENQYDEYPHDSKESHWCNTAFSFHLKKSTKDAYEVSCKPLTWAYL